MQDLNDIYTYDDGLLLNKFGHIFCNLDRDGYIRVRRNGKETRAHRIIWEMHNGPIPEGMFIDHIDRDVFNNRIENLRLVTKLQNGSNRKGRSSTLPKGVTKVGNRYRAKIMYNGITTSLGTYDTPEEAGQAYQDAAEVVQGEYALKI